MLLVATILLLSPLVSGQRREWCDMGCGDDTSFVNNTMCQFDELSRTPECGRIVNSLGSSQARNLLDAHNGFRNDFAAGLHGWPQSANMKLLTWDVDLARVAQRWATQCLGDVHDECRRTPAFDSVGQNIMTFSVPSGVPGQSSDELHMWIDEKNNAPLMISDDFRPEIYGVTGNVSRFTQLIWANTFKIGCGEILYNGNESVNVLLVCNYGPAGNIYGQPIYQDGDPCSQCPNGTSCYSNSRFPYLCATSTDQDYLFN